MPGPSGYVGCRLTARELLLALVAALVALALPTAFVSLTHGNLLSDRFFNEAFTSVRQDVSIQPRNEYLP